MLDSTLLTLYKEAIHLKEQQDRLSKDWEENIEKGIQAGYLTTDRRIPPIEQYRTVLRAEVLGLLERDKIEEAEELLRYINNPRQLAVKPTRREREPAGEAESLYADPLPDDIYHGAGTLRELLARARTYRTGRGDKKPTWNRIAKAAGITPRYMYVIGRGGVPSEEKVERIAAALGGDPGRFLEIADRTKSKDPPATPGSR